MAARHNLNPNQLAMFIPAGELVRTHNLGDAGNWAEQDIQTKEYVLGRKQKNNVERTNEYNGPRDFDNGGIKEPLSIDHRVRRVKGGIVDVPEVDDGHHRLAHAYHTDPKTEVPVTHTDAMNSRRMSEYHQMSADKQRRQRAIASIPKGAK